MFETIVAIVLLVVIPYLFHQLVTKRYYQLNKVKDNYIWVVEVKTTPL